MAAIADRPNEATRPPLVLIVEDEPLVRLAAGDALRRAGFKVVEAATGDEALALLTSGVSPQIVFTDVRMPGKTDGLALLSFVAENAPGARVFVTSGHLNPGELKGVRFVSKPYDPEQLAGLFKAVMSENDRPA